jgi:hypothetical protein
MILEQDEDVIRAWLTSCGARRRQGCVRPQLMSTLPFQTQVELPRPQGSKSTPIPRPLIPHGSHESHDVPSLFPGLHSLSERPRSNSKMDTRNVCSNRRYVLFSYSGILDDPLPRLPWDTPHAMPCPSYLPHYPHARSIPVSASSPLQRTRQVDPCLAASVIETGFSGRRSRRSEQNLVPQRIMETFTLPLGEVAQLGWRYKGSKQANLGKAGRQTGKQTHT